MSKQDRRDRRHERDAIFYWRTGLEYRWWRRINWAFIIAVVSTLAFYAVLILVVGAWIFDWSPWW